MKSFMFATALVAALAMSPAVSAQDASHAHAAAPAASSSLNAAQLQLHDTVRDRWVGHIFWVRNYVVASADHNAKARKVAADQAVANAKQLAGAIGTYYGKDAGSQMLTLLAGHWGAIQEYSDATFDHKGKGQQEALAKANANVKEIAAFLSKANPYLPDNVLIGMLDAHVIHHTMQIKEIAKADYVAEAKTWDAMLSHMNDISDAMSGAIAKQFPDKF